MVTFAVAMNAKVLQIKGKYGSDTVSQNSVDLHMKEIRGKEKSVYIALTRLWMSGFLSQDSKLSQLSQDMYKQ